MSAALAYAPLGRTYSPSQAQTRGLRQRSYLSGQSWPRDLPDDWRSAALVRIQKLMALQIGWDGHSGRPLALSTAVFALEVLEQIMVAGVPLPSIMPLSYGGLQIEWHRRGWDIEIEVARPNELHVWAHDLVSNREYELDATENIAPIFDYVNHITG